MTHVIAGGQLPGLPGIRKLSVFSAMRPRSPVGGSLERRRLSPPLVGFFFIGEFGGQDGRGR
jgi:hypothetical protein